ncbi:MAG: DUF1573 domain-containing protein [Bacteroidetes bacterium]|nr:DUF1573 domain-containing protein [Bacteroidota bacterium]
MKRSILTFFVAIGFVASGFAQEPAKATLTTDGGANIKFETTEHNFGTIKEGTQATYTFRFQNTGKDTLRLSSVQASCGCTTPKWTKDGIAKGQYGEITVTYNSKGRPGNFTKTITVKHNGEGGTEYLTIRGVVESEPAQPTPPVQANPQ